MNPDATSKSIGPAYQFQKDIHISWLFSSFLILTIISVFLTYERYMVQKNFTIEDEILPMEEALLVE